jgi:hypothetical protein
MGGEWSKAVKIIFNKKYSNGRGKLADAMKDPETKALHSSMLGKKPMKPAKFMKVKNTNFKKTQKFKKAMRGGADTPGVDASSPVSGEEVAGVGTDSTAAGEASTSEPKLANIERRLLDLEKTVNAMKDDKLGTTSATTNATDDDMGGGGKKSKKNRSNKIKDKKGKSFRKKCGW